jgi:hypothetical protein
MERFAEPVIGHFAPTRWLAMTARSRSPGGIAVGTLIAERPPGPYGHHLLLAGLPAHAKRNPGPSLHGAKFRISLRSSGLLPFLRYPLAGDVCTGSAQGRRLMGFMRIGRPIYVMRDHIFGCVDIPDGGLTRSNVPAKGLRFGKAGVVTCPTRIRDLALPSAACWLRLECNLGSAIGHAVKAEHGDQPQHFDSGRVHRHQDH